MRCKYQGCSSLTNVTINSNAIVSKTYTSSSNLKNIFGSQVANYELGNDVTSIGNCAFYDCSGLKSLKISDNVTSFASNSFYNVPATALQVNRGSKSLLALWAKSYEPYELGTTNRLVEPTLTAVSATQSSIKLKAEPVYNEYKYYIWYYGGYGTYHEMTDGELLLTGLYPEYDYSVQFYIADGDMNSSPMPYYIDKGWYKFETKPISPSFQERVTASSIHITGSYIKGDAEVTSESASIYRGSVDNSNLIKTVHGKDPYFTGLDPNTSYTVVYSIVANGRTCTSKAKTVKTAGLSFTTSQPKVVSPGNAIVAAETNLDNEETNVGFEWRRTDWTDDFASNTGEAYLYEGTMEGYIRNLNTEKLWKYRPYYISNDGRKYYSSDWVGIDPTNTSYFEPTVHTYTSINIEGNTALVKGYALTGTDKITVQGFKYWKTVAGVKDREGVNRIASVPSDAMTVEADGQVMTANLTGLDYNSTYHYLAFATTSEGNTYYGEEQVFETGDDPTGIESVEAEPTEQKPVTVIARYNMNGQQISAPQKGINILRMSDGTVKKVLVK